MAKYIGKRLVTGILSLFVLATVTFFLTRVIPGSPFQGANVSESVLQMMEEEYGLHQPAGVQYVTYMKHLLRGNLGYSYQNPSESVANIIQRSWPVTAVIGVLAILLAMIVGIGIGVWQTFSRHRLPRGGLFTGTLLIGGVPNFVAALLLMLVFGVWLKWLPVSGLDSWKNYILPVCALALYPACSLARLTGTLLAQEKQRDYVLLARTKGLKKRQILFTHILPHIWIPVLNYLGPASAFLLTGSFVVESIFTIPGLGRQFVSSIANRDYTLILGLTIFMGAVVILIQLAVDLLSACIDPRVRRSYVDEE